VYRIRFHGRGGQGIKLGARALGSAFFAEGFEVQDSPRYGAERRGAPISAYVRASHGAIHERGPIREPDLVIVADETLVPVSTAGVLEGLAPRTVLLVHGAESAATWRERLRLEGPIVTLPAAGSEAATPPGSACAGAAARLVGVISRTNLEAAIREETAALGERAVEATVAAALDAFDRMGPDAGCVVEGGTPQAGALPSPDWVELPVEGPSLSAPDIFAARTSVEVRTGLWRTMRPVLDEDRCHRCTWICSSHCPDGAISTGSQGFPQIDYDHCKGCLVCVAVCPSHAIRAVAEAEADATPARSGAQEPAR